MSFKTASAILRGAWLIQPDFANAQLPIVLQMIKASQQGHSAELPASFQDRIGTKTDMSLPTRRSFTSSTGSTPTDIYQVNPYTSTDRLPYDSIVMVDIIGPILKYGDYCSWGSMEQSDFLIKLANSNRVKGVLLNFDTPGGQAAGTAHFAQTIKEVSKVKPVLGICQDGIVASAGMWLASACQEFYVTQKTDMVGSIGAYQTIYDFAGYFDQNGINIYEIYAPQSEDKNKGYRDLIASKGENDTAIKDELKFLTQDFINAVKTNRGGRLNTSAENPFTGKMYYAQDAKNVGLIDGIKPLAGVVKRMEQLISLRA